MDETNHSHEGFSDESKFNIGRFRSLAVVTATCSHIQNLRENIIEINTSSGLREFKWYNLRQARERFAAIKLLDCALDNAWSDHIRIDTLIWDTSDSRHDIINRDDIANMGRMYYHLFRNVMRLRWPNSATWKLFPDEQSSINWSDISDSLQNASSHFELRTKDLFNSPSSFAIALKKEFGVKEIMQVQSHMEPICQLADLFAGLGAFSYLDFNRYSIWLQQNAPTISLPFDELPPQKLSNSESNRFVVLKYLSDSCKTRKLGVSLNSSKGLKTYNPKYPINFWLYVPQNYSDKAPTKCAAGA